MHFAGEFDETADVAVLGFGNAGAVAAVTAHDAGARVVVLEKQQARTHRPNSRYAAGFFLVPNDIDGACRYVEALYAVNGERVRPELIRTWAEQTAANPAWLAEHGGEYAVLDLHGEHDTLPDHKSVTVYKALPTERSAAHPGCPLHGFLRSLVAERDIEVRYGTRATALLTGADGGVVGVRVGDTSRDIGVRRGVVLAVGGFGGDESLKRQYLPVTPAHFYGSQDNTGDGIRMAQDVGADLWHMNTWPGHFVARFPGAGYAGGTGIDLWGSGRFGPAADGGPNPGSIFVDGSARRFLAEPGRQHAANLELTAMDARSLTHPRIPTWWIFDDARFHRSPLVPNYSGPTGPVRDYAWSADNSTELERGWISCGTSIRDLAAACDLDPDALSTTVGRYNELCAGGRDHDFGRDPATLTPLSGERFYAVPLWPGGSHTVGGPRRDEHARVVAAHGGAIANLYSAGELGSMHGLLYPAGGASLAECMAFGRIAGASASANRTGVR